MFGLRVRMWRDVHVHVSLTIPLAVGMENFPTCANWLLGIMAKFCRPLEGPKNVSLLPNAYINWFDFSLGLDFKQWKYLCDENRVSKFLRLLSVSSWLRESFHCTHLPAKLICYDATAKSCCNGQRLLPRALSGLFRTSRDQKKEIVGVRMWVNAKHTERPSNRSPSYTARRKTAQWLLVSGHPENVRFFPIPTLEELPHVVSGARTKLNSQEIH